MKFSVLINGSPKGFFSSMRGLRQGDPLSPFLFILAMEGLSSMMRASTISGCLKGFEVQNRINSMEISHLLYADVALVLCDAEPAQLMHLRLVLTVFESISGFHVNWRKSMLVPINAVPNSPILAGILGCEVGNLPTKYLGLSLGSKNKVADI